MPRIHDEGDEGRGLFFYFLDSFHSAKIPDGYLSDTQLPSLFCANASDSLKLYCFHICIPVVDVYIIANYIKQSTLILMFHGFRRKKMPSLGGLGPVIITGGLGVENDLSIRAYYRNARTVALLNLLSLRVLNGGGGSKREQGGRKPKHSILPN